MMLFLWRGFVIVDGNYWGRGGVRGGGEQRGNVGSTVAQHPAMQQRR
jgi:hypothetical protein